ncbi:hypothetical protein, partial [Actinomadura logoneensis]|uniref:hypothetical protein n=1 Tax=Actinomadura logoneensis TaxID=2293572 RepID=UPI001F3A82B0
MRRSRLAAADQVGGTADGRGQRQLAPDALRGVHQRLQQHPQPDVVEVAALAGGALGGLGVRLGAVEADARLAQLLFGGGARVAGLGQLPLGP